MILINPYLGTKEYLPGYRKPSFRFASTKSIVVPGPSHFILGGSPIYLSSDIECNLTINGAGGLDRGSLAASTVYYLYGISTDSGVKLVASLTSPRTFSGYTWTYLGGFLTGTTSLVDQFVSSDGLMLMTPSTIADITVNNATEATITPQVPVTAKYGYFRSIWTNVISAGNDLNVGSLAGTSASRHRASTTTAGNNDVAYWWVQFLTDNTLYASTGSSSTALVRLFGWVENPSEYI